MYNFFVDYFFLLFLVEFRFGEWGDKSNNYTSLVLYFSLMGNEEGFRDVM